MLGTQRSRPRIFRFGVPIVHVLGYVLQFYYCPTLHALQAVPKEKWPTTCVDQVMIPTDQVKQINPDTEIWEAIEEMDRDGVNQLPVMLDGQIQGILTREDVISYIRRMSGAAPRT